MDKKLSVQLTLTPEWTAADEALKEDSKRIAIELRQFRMPAGESIVTAYKQINGDVLPELSSKARNALTDLARSLGKSGNNSWMFAFTRVEAAESGSGGLSLDEERIYLLGLTGKAPVEAFFKKVMASFGDDLQESRACGFTGLSWGRPQQKFLVITVPAEKRDEVEKIAERTGFRLSGKAPHETVLDKVTHRVSQVEYPRSLFEGEKLLYAVAVQQENPRVPRVKPAGVKPGAKGKQRSR